MRKNALSYETTDDDASAPFSLKCLLAANPIGGMKRKNFDAASIHLYIYLFIFNYLYAVGGVSPRQHFTYIYIVDQNSFSMNIAGLSDLNRLDGKACGIMEDIKSKTNERNYYAA